MVPERMTNGAMRELLQARSDTLAATSSPAESIHASNEMSFVSQHGRKRKRQLSGCIPTTMPEAATETLELAFAGEDDEGEDTVTALSQQRTPRPQLMPAMTRHMAWKVINTMNLERTDWLAQREEMWQRDEEMMQQQQELMTKHEKLLKQNEDLMKQQEDMRSQQKAIQQLTEQARQQMEETQQQTKILTRRCDDLTTQLECEEKRTDTLEGHLAKLQTIEGRVNELESKHTRQQPAGDGNALSPGTTSSSSGLLHASNRSGRVAIGADDQQQMLKTSSQGSWWWTPDVARLPGTFYVDVALLDLEPHPAVIVDIHNTRNRVQGWFYGGNCNEEQGWLQWWDMNHRCTRRYLIPHTVGGYCSARMNDERLSNYREAIACSALRAFALGYRGSESTDKISGLEGSQYVVLAGDCIIVFYKLPEKPVQ